MLNKCIKKGQLKDTLEMNFYFNQWARMIHTTLLYNNVNLIPQNLTNESDCLLIIF